MVSQKNITAAHNTYLENMIRTASKEQLLLITYDIGIKSCKAAEIAISEQKYDETNEHLKRAQNVIRELMITLRVKDENPVTTNLMKLYDFMYDSLVKANVTKDVAQIEQIRIMLEDLKATWEESIVKIAEEYDEFAKEQYENNLPSQDKKEKFSVQG